MHQKVALHYVAGIALCIVSHIAEINAAAPLLDTSLLSVQNEILKTHNDLRRKVATTQTFSLTWDSELAQNALKWALTCNSRPHPNPQTYPSESQYTKTSNFSNSGQNMAGNYNASWTTVITNQWYAEVKDFKYGVDPKPAVVGHYTQVVWDKTYKVGCAHAVCSGMDKYFCNYGPAGNVMPNQFKPYTAGQSCGSCLNKCDAGLCTNPCPKQNYYSNCDAQLFPNGCANAPAYLQPYLTSCNATCACKGTLLY